MKIDFDKCIYCLKKSADSWERIIPDSIGGRLQVQLFCSNCNKIRGSVLISKIKVDSSIRLAVKNLKDVIPALFETMENRQIYTAKDNNGNYIKLKYRNGEFETIADKKEDNSLFLDTKRVEFDVHAESNNGGTALMWAASARLLSALILLLISVAQNG